MRNCSPKGNLDHATLGRFFQRFDGVFGAAFFVPLLFGCGEDSGEAVQAWELTEEAGGDRIAPIHPDLDRIVGNNPHDPSAAAWCDHPRCAPSPLDSRAPPLGVSTCMERHFVYTENGSRDFRDRLTYSFDDAGRLLEETSNGSVTRYEYDHRDALASTIEIAHGVEKRRIYSRSSEGVLSHIDEHNDLGEQLIMTFAYDERGRLVELVDYEEDLHSPTRTTYHYANRYTRTTSRGARGQERPIREERWHPNGSPDYIRQLSASTPSRQGLYRFVYDEARPELLIGHRTEGPNHDPIDLERYHYNNELELVSYHMALATGAYEGLEIEDRVEIERRDDGHPSVMNYFGSRRINPEYKITFEGQACDRTISRWKRDARRAMLRSCGELPCLP